MVALWGVSHTSSQGHLGIPYPNPGTLHPQSTTVPNEATAKDKTEGTPPVTLEPA